MASAALNNLRRLHAVWDERAAVQAILEEQAKSYGAAERRKLASEGKALSDGSYPIVDAEDLKNALTLARSGHGNVSAAMALIRRRAKALGVKLNEKAMEEQAKSYGAAERRKLASEGKALSDGSYPIVDAEDLKNALTLARSGHGNVSAAMALIRRRAKALGVKLNEKAMEEIAVLNGLTEGQSS